MAKGESEDGAGGGEYRVCWGGGVIWALAALAEGRRGDDEGIVAHLQRVQSYVRVLAGGVGRHAGASGWTDARAELLAAAAPLHDIGMSRVPESILRKAGWLTADELREMRRHTVYGREALGGAAHRLGASPLLALAQEVAYSHHEMWNGEGYPQGLSGEEIPLAGRIVAVADVYDALISPRSYKSSYSHDQACAIVHEGRGSHFDPRVVDTFLAQAPAFAAIAQRFAVAAGPVLEF
jgi:putative two-component system response regulator